MARAVLDLRRRLEEVHRADDEYLQANPIIQMGRMLPKVSRERKAAKAWTRAELTRLLEAALQVLGGGSDEHLAIEIQAAAGVRIGAVCGLRWTDLDGNHGRLLVRKARVRGELFISTAGNWLLHGISQRCATIPESEFSVRAQRGRRVDADKPAGRDGNHHGSHH